MKKNLSSGYELIWDPNSGNVFVFKGPKVVAVYEAPVMEIAKSVMEWCSKVYKEFN